MIRPVTAVRSGEGREEMVEVKGSRSREEAGRRDQLGGEATERVPFTAGSWRLLLPTQEVSAGMWRERARYVDVDHMTSL